MVNIKLDIKLFQCLQTVSLIPAPAPAIVLTRKTFTNPKFQLKLKDLSLSCLPVLVL